MAQHFWRASDYPLGTPPNNITVFGASTGSIVSDAASPSGFALQCTRNPGAADRGVYFNDFLISSITNEIYVVCRRTEANVAFRSGANEGNPRYTINQTDVTYSTAASVRSSYFHTLNFSSAYVALRCVLDGITVEADIAPAGTTLVSALRSTYSAAISVSNLYASMSDTATGTLFLSEIGLGTDGDPAPTGPLGTIEPFILRHNPSLNKVIPVLSSPTVTDIGANCVRPRVTKGY